MTMSETLADFVTSTKYDDLPPLAIKHAKVIVASTIASAAMGRDIGSTAIFRELAKERGGTPESSIWFDAGPNVPVMDAARTNAIMSDAAASDDTDLAGSGHLGTVASTAAITMGERCGASPREVLAGIVLGYDVANRIGRRTHSGELGFHAGVNTIFGATVAAGRVMGLGAKEMAHAISLAATSIGGNGVAANTSWVREYDACLSAELAITAVQAAAKGFFAEVRVLEMPRGALEVFQTEDVEGITKDLGKRWGILEDLAIKLMPGTWAYQALAEAAWTATKEGDLKPEQVEKIVVSSRRFGGHLVYHPTDLIGVAHSLPYMLAASVVDRTYSWQHAAPEKYLDPVIDAMQDKVVDGDPSPFAARGGGSVTITTTDGRTYSCTMEAPGGSGPRGIEWADIDYKYRTLAPLGGMSAARIDQSLDVIHEFQDAPTVSSLTDLLRP
ncbi:MAG: MmgE/PrpD family protein [Chloroflexi bacterium]|nr:MmgE/PrpD family protein [Chloroflexota bacterium]